MGGRTLATCALALLLAPGTAGAASSLPSVESGARPGPDILYGPAVDAPQLQNAETWKASRVLVSGGGACRDGKYLYQEWLLEAHGAIGTEDPADPFSEI